MSFWQWALLVGEMTAILGAFVLVRLALYLRDLAKLEKERQKWRRQIDAEREEYNRHLRKAS
jgi:uncharacterized membrane-anchored protein YhcB (DUF1043 family)